MLKQPPYTALFSVGDIVEVAQAPLDGESGVTWLRGEVVKVNLINLHVRHGRTVSKYPRAMYNRGEIRGVSSPYLQATPPKKRAVPTPMSESQAARALASMFVRGGIPESATEPGCFWVTEDEEVGDGRLVTIQVLVSNLDVEPASTGHHMDQERLEAIREEWSR